LEAIKGEKSTETADPSLHHTMTVIFTRPKEGQSEKSRVSGGTKPGERAFNILRSLVWTKVSF